MMIEIKGWMKDVEEAGLVESFFVQGERIVFETQHGEFGFVEKCKNNLHLSLGQQDHTLSYQFLPLYEALTQDTYQKQNTRTA